MFKASWIGIFTNYQRRQLMWSISICT